MSAKTTAAPFTVVYRDDLTAVCPHCSHEITEVYARRKGAPYIEGRTLMFFCPHCRKVLGFGKERMI